jgi:hypothetical protein
MTSPKANRYSMDRYDGGRTASEPEEFRTSVLSWIERPRSIQPSDDDTRALAMAILALTSADE